MKTLHNNSASRFTTRRYLVGYILLSFTLFVIVARRGNNTNNERDERNLRVNNDEVSRRLQSRRLFYEPPKGRHSKGKGALFHILAKAGVIVDDEVAIELPSWPQIEELYGPDPVISGTETCAAMMEHKKDGNIVFTISGLYNTGMLRLEKLLKQNCDVPVIDNPWWKHSPASLSHAPEHVVRPNLFEKTIKKLIGNDEQNADYSDNIFQIVTVKNPFSWIVDVCRNHFRDGWGCPNHISENSTPLDFQKPLGPDNAEDRIPLKYDSVVDLWNKWNEEHFLTSRPHLIVRYEDLLFHAERVVTEICECAGGKVKHQFIYPIEEDRPPQQRGVTSQLAATMIKYGKYQTWHQFSAGDLETVRAKLNPDLMKRLRYSMPFLKWVN